MWRYGGGLWINIEAQPGGDLRSEPARRTLRHCYRPIELLVTGQRELETSFSYEFPKLPNWLKRLS